MSDVFVVLCFFQDINGNQATASDYVCSARNISRPHVYPECNPLLCDVTDVAMWQIGEWGDVSSNNALRMKLSYKQ